MLAGNARRDGTVVREFLQVHNKVAADYSFLTLGIAARVAGSERVSV
jgi:hypothetical protein